MYHSSKFSDLLQLNLKLHSIFPKFMETKVWSQFKTEEKKKS